MPVLRIVYNEITLFDGEVSSFRWDDVPGQSVTVAAQLIKPKATANSGGLSAIAEMIAQASKAKTVEKRRELAQDTEIVKEAADD